MNSNENQLDLDFISIIKSEEFMNSLQKLNNSLICQQNSNHLKTINESIDGLNENLKQYYDSFVLNSEEWFVCKYDDCDHSERSEADILRHLSHHLAQENEDEIEVKPNISNIVFNDNNEPLLPNNLVIDENLFDVKPNVKSDESVRKDCALEGRPSRQSVVGSALEDLADLDMHIEKRGEKFGCRWTDCQFEAHQKSVISKHVLDKHLAPKQPNPFEGVDSETKYWETIMKSSKQWLQKPNSNAKSAQSLPGLLPSLPSMPSLTAPQGLAQFIEPSLQPLMGQLLDEKQWLERITSMATLQVFGSQLGMSDKGLDKNGFDVSLEEKEKLKNHLNISNKEENILLSCKGLAAMSKVRQYYESQVIDGQKVFFCRWRQNGSVCTFQTRKSQKIAQHINLSHIGVEFKCPKPFCNKVFKNPNTYREHQKNHICGFGIFGYGSKGVIGACRNENLNRYRDRVVIEGKKFYRCIYMVNGAQCGAITRYHMAMKRHIHSHTCPHRKNLKLKQNQEIIHKMKSDNWNLDLGLGAGASTSSASISPLSSPNSNPSMSETKSSPSIASSSTSSKKTYQCRRTNCTATFGNTADLLKHENLLCKFVKNGLTQNLFNNKSVGKHMPTISAEELAASAATKQSVLQQNGYKLGNTSHANSASLRAAETVNRYLSTKTMNGVDYHLCVYPKCKFTSKVMIKTIEHIHSQHLMADSQLHIESNQLSTNSAKRVRTSTESPETDSSKENSAKKSKPTVTELVSNVSPSQVLEPMLAAMSGHLAEAYPYQLSAHHQLNPHLMDTHNYFVCDLENCTKQFRSEAALNHHRINHICGFGIKGKRAIGVCDLDNVRSYREVVVVDEKTVYLCKLCRKVSENKSSALICIHSHICPARLSIVDPQDSAFTESVVQRIIETNRKKSSAMMAAKASAKSSTVPMVDV